MDSSTLRRWAGRGAVAIAALASVATSKPGWHVDAALPPGAPSSTPATGSQGILMTVEASRRPTVPCRLHAYEVLAPLAPLAPNTMPWHADYLCPPGGALAGIMVEGPSHSGREVPAGEYVRITKAALVQTWAASDDATFDVMTDTGDYATASAGFRVMSDSEPFFEITVEPGGDGARLSDARVYPRSEITNADSRARYYELQLASGATDRPLSGKVHVKATVYGVCGADCKQPADGSPPRPADGAAQPALVRIERP
jgi:hypothetical protein